MLDQNVNENIKSQNKQFDKQKLLELLESLIEAHPIEFYNEHTYLYSRTYRKCLTDIYNLLRIL